MRRAAERRGQATVEHLALVAIVAVALGLVALGPTGLAARIAAGLTPEPSRASAAAQAALVAALSPAPGGPSLLGARRWIADETDAATAERLLAEGLAGHLRQRAAWDDPVALGLGAALPADGAMRMRVVGADEEARWSSWTPGARDRVQAGASALAWDGATALAHRIGRPLGLGVSALQLAVGVAEDDDPLPPGLRAGDAIACRPMRILQRSGGRLTGAGAVPAWRVTILRSGRIVADALSADDRACRAPTG